MANKIRLNNIPASVFKVAANEVADGSNERADIVSTGRLLMREHTGKGVLAIRKALNKAEDFTPMLSSTQYAEANEKFQKKLFVYCAKMAANQTGEAAPETFEDFKRRGLQYYGDRPLYRVLQGVITEVVTPILPATYSEAVDVFADTQSVGFGETLSIDIGSNDIPVFQDSSWGASRSVPKNRLYDKTITLNPQPKTAAIVAKWTQLLANGFDFGRFFASIAAGMYAKTMGMWQAAMTVARQNTALVPSNLVYTFSNDNFVTAATKVAALNSTNISNLIVVGGYLPLSHILPTQVSLASPTTIDAALATLLGRDYVRAGYIGEFMGVRLLPIMDAIVPGTQNSAPATVLETNVAYIMATNGYKPMTIAYNGDTPITIDIDPEKTADFMIGINVTMALDMAAVFASKMAVITPV